MSFFIHFFMIVNSHSQETIYRLVNGSTFRGLVLPIKALLFQDKHPLLRTAHQD